MARSTEESGAGRRRSAAGSTSSSSTRGHARRRDDRVKSGHRRHPQQQQQHRRRRAGNDDDDDDDDEQSAQDGVGINKIKAALRQTRRLLARDTVKADARQEAERKLAALEGELKSRTLAQRERKNATRYHKVRFFERQKLTRRIGKLKKRLEQTSSEQERRSLDKDIYDSRVLLNYVLHFPNAQKYVALFPNTGPSPLDEGEAAAAGRDDEASQTAARAREVHTQIQAAMKGGKLSEEPDGDLAKRYEQVHEENQSAAAIPGPIKRKADVGRTRVDFSTSLDERQADAKKKSKSKKFISQEDNDMPAADAAAETLADDDFFA